MLKICIKRFLLIIIGIILSLILLECGLRLAGWTISSYQQYKNNKALRNKSEYTIMCLGESTTAYQYPIQLHKMLDKQHPNKFSVIDCGIPGTKLNFILDSIDNNINKYHPDITICMMGINDSFVDFNATYHSNYVKKNKNINLKIYKLFTLIKLHLKTLLLNNVAFAQQINNENNLSIKNAIDLRNLGKIKESEAIFNNILKLDPNNQIAFNELCVLYFDFLNQRALGYEMAVTGLQKQFNYEKQWYYKIIFQNLKNGSELQYYINKAINEDLFIFTTDIKYFLYGYIKNYITAEQKEQILKVMIKDNDNDLGVMAIESINNKNYQKSKEYFDKAEEIRLNFPNMETYNLYKMIVEKLINNNIKVICMQYPVRSIKPLQEQLKNEPYYNKLTFISNEKPFKDALMKKNYNEIFTDQFAGDFGHCTNLGNTIVAKNIVNTLENILDLKEKSN